MNARYIDLSFSRTRTPWLSRRDAGAAFEFDDGEIGLHTVDHGVEESPEHRVGCRDAPAEIDPVCNLDAGHEARVARDVGEQQVPLACRRICLGR